MVLPPQVVVNAFTSADQARAQISACICSAAAPQAAAWEDHFRAFATAWRECAAAQSSTAVKVWTPGSSGSPKRNGALFGSDPLAWSET